MTIRELVPTVARAGPAGPFPVTVPVLRNIETADWDSVLFDWTGPAGDILVATWHDRKRTITTRSYLATAVLASGGLSTFAAPVRGPLLDLDLIAQSSALVTLGVSVTDMTVPEPTTLLYSGDISGLGNVSLDVGPWPGIILEYEDLPTVGTGYILSARWDSGATGASPLVMDQFGPGVFIAQVLNRARQYVDCQGASLRFSYTPSGAVGPITVNVYGVPQAGRHSVYHPSLAGTVVCDLGGQNVPIGGSITSQFISGGFPANAFVDGPAAGWSVIATHITAVGTAQRLTRLTTVAAPGFAQSSFWVPPGNTQFSLINGTGAIAQTIATNLIATD